jgi:pimeloyl-ACP methyl ester carboxylesterase
VFDDFAPRFADKFHVIALTRRGYGESGRPDDGYDTERLTDDVRDMLDSLKLDRVVLVGHSVAGDELSDFAARFPQRTAGVVYLDAAYDRSGTTGRLIAMAIGDRLPPSPPAPDDDECASVDSYREYLQKIYGVSFPKSEVRATRLFDAQGRYECDATDGGTNMKVMRGEKEPEYEKITAPVLALYAVGRGLEQDYAWTKSLFIGRGAAENKARRAMIAQENFESAQREKFREALPNARVVEVSGASHYIFLSHAELVEREMREFLARTSAGVSQNR